MEDGMQVGDIHVKAKYFDAIAVALEDPDLVLSVEKIDCRCRKCGLHWTADGDDYPVECPMCHTEHLVARIEYQTKEIARLEALNAQLVEACKKTAQSCKTCLVGSCGSDPYEHLHAISTIVEAAIQAAEEAKG